MARRHSAASKSSSTSITAVRSCRWASCVISPCTRAWAPERGGLAGIWETHRILRRSGVIDPGSGSPYTRPPDPVGGRRIRQLTQRVQETQTWGWARIASFRVRETCGSASVDVHGRPPKAARSLFARHDLQYATHL